MKWLSQKLASRASVMGMNVTVLKWTWALAAVSAMLLLTPRLQAAGGTWSSLVNPPPFRASTSHLMTDGTVMSHEYATRHWWKLTPDSSGSYANGTWSQLGDMPAGYAPLYYASAVLPDGRLIVMGGEYLCSPACNDAWTNLGAIYNPATNVWTAVNPPAGWTSIGDAQATVLPNGRFMLADALSRKIALFDATTLTWTNLLATGKEDSNNEEGWNLLPNGKVLTVETFIGGGAQRRSQIYDPATDTWSFAGLTTADLVDVASREIGPGILLPSGLLLQTGGTVHNSIYDYQTNSWSTAPDFPGGNGVADGPASLLPNGNVLVFTSPGVFNTPTSLFEFEAGNWVPVPAPAGASTASSYYWRSLLLPTGQVLATRDNTAPQIYTPTNPIFNPAWAPVITAAPLSIAASQTYTVTGTQFNGLSEGSFYGDDAQAATNYPVLQIRNNASGHIQYAKTHDHSRMGVATGAAPVSTLFDVPSNVEIGASTLCVVVNGIPSACVATNVLGALPPTVTKVFTQNTVGVSATVQLTLTIANPNAIAMTNVAIADTLTGGLIVSISPAVTNTCGGTLTAAPLSTSIALTNGSLGANASCQISVKLQATQPGTVLNSTTVVTAKVGTEAVTGTQGTATVQVDPAQDAFLMRYAANLPAGDSVINLTNMGTMSSNPGIPDPQNGSICANIYAYSPDEQLVSCCSCLVTPNALASLSVRNDLASNTLTPIQPSSLVMKLVASSPVGGTCSPATVTRGGATNFLVPGLMAWGTTLHPLPVTAGSPAGTFGVVEGPFLSASLSDAELQRATQLCAFIQANGSGYGICKSCKVGGLGAAVK